MQQHTKHFWTHLVLLCSLKQKGGAAVRHGKMLSLMSGFLWIVVYPRQLRTQKRTRSNLDDFQVRALERGPSSRLAIPSWMTIQKVFSQLEWPMLNDYPFNLGKETIKPRFGTTHPLN
jgi:hypothetical protein